MEKKSNSNKGQANLLLMQQHAAHESDYSHYTQHNKKTTKIKHHTRTQQQQIDTKTLLMQMIVVF